MGNLHFFVFKSKGAKGQVPKKLRKRASPCLLLSRDSFVRVLSSARARERESSSPFRLKRE